MITFSTNVIYWQKPHSGLVLCNTWNWSHDNNTVSGIEYRDTIAIPEVHMKR